MKGLGPRVLAMAPASVLIVSVYELIKRLSRKTPPVSDGEASHSSSATTRRGVSAASS